MLGKIRNFCSACFSGYHSDPVTRFANSGWGTACSPDDLIASYIIQSFTKDFASWEANFPELPETRLIGDRATDLGPATYLFTLKGPDCEFKAIKSIKTFRRLGDSQRFLVSGSQQWTQASADGVEISPHLAEKIISAYIQVSEAIEQAQKVAEQAKREMEENEKKWDLAERLLGMKRNSQGVLVPILPAGNEEGSTA